MQSLTSKIDIDQMTPSFERFIHLVIETASILHQL